MGYAIPSGNTTGIDNMIVDVVTAVPIFVPSLLLFIYFVVFLTGFRKQSERSSTGGDMPLWGTIAGIVTSIVALILSTREGLITLPILVMPIVITIVSAIWLFASKDRY